MSRKLIQGLRGGSFGRRLIAPLCALTFAASAAAAQGAPRIPAFPEAEGAGAWTPGGRGGPALFVTNLEDYRPGEDEPVAGSLRAAIDAKGPRMILFRVAGTIELKEDLEIREPYVTIAGQSAPGGGIALRRYPLQIRTHDVIVRHLRVRPGDEAGEEMDGLSSSGQNVIIDHCSISWGIDETLSVTGPSANVTVQWCIIAESLNASIHRKGEHGYGSLINGEGPISFHHNLYAHHRSRNPRPGDVDLDFRNNVIYGWRDRAGYSGENIARMNLVANYYRAGAHTRDRSWIFSPGGPEFLMHVEGNVLEGILRADEEQWRAIRPLEGYSAADSAALIGRPRPFPSEPVAAESAEDAFKLVLARAGATLPERDAADTRVIYQVRNNLGRIIDAPREGGGWPELARGTPAPDADADGMPDAWETLRSLNPADAADGPKDADGDGYTNLEEFLNGTDPREAQAWLAPPRIELARGSAGQPAGERNYAFIDGVKVVISSDAPDIQICYTTDGSAPGPDSPRFSGGPLALSESTHLRARAFRGGLASREGWAVFEKLPLRLAAAPASAAPGLAFAYYEAEDWEQFPAFERLTAVKTGAAPRLDLAERAREGGYGMVYEGFIQAPAGGIYTFYSRSNQRSQLYVAGEKVVESKGREVTRAGRIALAKGLHPLRALAYFPTDDRNAYEIAWEGPGFARAPIPAEALFHAPR